MTAVEAQGRRVQTWAGWPAVWEGHHVRSRKISMQSAGAGGRHRSAFIKLCLIGDLSQIFGYIVLSTSKFSKSLVVKVKKNLFFAFDINVKCLLCNIFLWTWLQYFHVLLSLEFLILPSTFPITLWQVKLRHRCVCMWVCIIWSLTWICLKATIFFSWF